MIEFDCPGCGKHFRFSPKFAGRQLKCVDCGAAMHVPAPPTDIASPTAEADILPSASAASSPPAPPVTTEARETPAEPPSPTDSAVLDLLAHAYQDAKHDAVEAERFATTPTPLPQPPKPEQPKSSAKWVSFVLLLLLAGAALAAWRWIDWSRPNPRLLEARRLKQESEERLIEAHEREMERRQLLAESQQFWTKADKSVDALIAATADLYQKQLAYEGLQQLIASGSDDSVVQSRLESAQKALEMAETRLSEHLAALSESRQKAAKNLVDADTVTVRWQELRQESDDLLRQSDEAFAAAAAEGANVGSEAEHAPRHALKKYPLARHRLADPMNDWTEGYMGDFRFPEATEQRFFATFDPGRRHTGEFSLRMTGLGESPLCVRLDAPEGTPWSVSADGCLAMLLRFPRVDELLDTILLTDQTGKIAHLNIRLGNESGVVQYDAVSRRFLEAVFYGGRGAFQSIEVPLAGDRLWMRSDKFDPAALDRLLPTSAPENETAATISAVPPEKRFFQRIEWLEVRFFPASAITTLWIDDFSFQDKKRYGNVDLAMMEHRQENQRRRDRDLIAERRREHIRRQAAAVAPEASEAASTSPGGAAATLQAIPGESLLDRSKRVADWVVGTAGGRVEIVYNGTPVEFGPGQTVKKTGFESIFAIDLTDCKLLGDMELDMIGSIRTLKQLRLARTGLTDAALIKLSTLEQLEALDLSGNRLTFDALPQLATVAESLRVLRLNDFQWGQRGLEPLRRFTNLRDLGLARSVINDSDFGVFIMLSKLETLSLQGTKVGDRVIGMLGTVKTLRSLDLRETRVTEAGVRELRKGIPDLTIIR